MSASNFHTVGLVGRFQDPLVLEPARALCAYLQARGLAVVVTQQVSDDDCLRRCRIVGEADLGNVCDLVIAIGGDGTMLHAVRNVARHGVPLVGINRGRLAFLTDISPEEMTGHLDGILAGRHVRDSRLLLEAEIERADGSRLGAELALNEVVLQKHQPGQILDISSWIDGDYLNTYGGDGLIVSTATGSTAYALSCGGPIVQPGLDALVVVPICPHTLSVRPLVAPAQCVVECRILPRQDNRAQVTCDGRLFGDLLAGDVLRIRVCEQRVTLLHPEGYSFFEILRNKLHWGRDSRQPVAEKVRK